MSINVQRYVQGGIGDILMSLQSAIEAQVIDVYTHYNKALDLFKPFPIQVNRIEYYKNVEDIYKVYIIGEPLEKHLFPDFPLVEPSVPRPSYKKIIGIHIEGSELSNNFWSQRGKPTKNMSMELLHKLLAEIENTYKDTFVYIFCSPAKKNVIEAETHKYLRKVIAFDNIWSSLSCVQHCDVVIGMDSCIKTMASILSIETVVLIGDYEDKFRDDTFITPYVSAGTMTPIIFSDINKVDPKEIIEKIKL